MCVTVEMLAEALRVMLAALEMDYSSHSLHSLRREGAVAAYHSRIDQLDIKRHGLWKSDTF